MLLTNCEINLILTWSGNFVIIVSTNVANQIATFIWIETKLYVPVVPLSTQDNGKLLTQSNSGFKKTINQNKCLSEPNLLAQNPNWNHLVEAIFHIINRLFVLGFENDT